MYRFSIAMARSGIVLPLFALLLRVNVCQNVTTTVFSFRESKNGLDLLTAESEEAQPAPVMIEDEPYAITTKTATMTVSPIGGGDNDEDDDEYTEASGGSDNLASIDDNDARNVSDIECRRMTNNLAIEIRIVMAITLIFTAVGFVILCGAIYFLARPALRSRREYDLRRATYVRLSDIGKVLRKSLYPR